MKEWVYKAEIRRIPGGLEIDGECFGMPVTITSDIAGKCRIVLKGAEREFVAGSLEDAINLVFLAMHIRTHSEGE